jgi:4-hydroxybutyryl-CoA dehydratase/vinylacetyl-CoA-Delta-isomerase
MPWHHDELAQRPEYEDLMTAVSHLTGKRINRFCHIHRNQDDLIKKSKMGRMLGGHTACCFQRCVGIDALNALSIVTYDIDAKYNTPYNGRFLKFLAHVQENDLTCDGAMTDPKGDRSLAPREQSDPDLYLHVVEERSDGIVVSGAKVHQTGAVNSHEIIVMPTIALRKEDMDYAVSFAVPSDTQGITYIIGRQSWILGSSKQGGWTSATRSSEDTRRWCLRSGVCSLGKGFQNEHEFAGSLVENLPLTTVRVTPVRRKRS